MFKQVSIDAILRVDHKINYGWERKRCDGLRCCGCSLSLPSFNMSTARLLNGMIMDHGRNQ
jgi:hypothetical protein